MRRPYQGAGERQTRDQRRERDSASRARGEPAQRTLKWRLEVSRLRCGLRGDTALRRSSQPPRQDLTEATAAWRALPLEAVVACRALARSCCGASRGLAAARPAVLRR